jgi:hypothetical protein
VIVRTFSRLALAAAVAAGGMRFRMFEQGSSAHRESGSFTPTAHDLGRIEAARLKRLRRQARNLEVASRSLGHRLNRYYHRPKFAEQRAFRQTCFFEKLSFQVAA